MARNLTLIVFWDCENFLDADEFYTCQPLLLPLFFFKGPLVKNKLDWERFLAS